jgi:hypothetical protein
MKVYIVYTNHGARVKGVYLTQRLADIAVTNELNRLFLPEDGYVFSDSWEVDTDGEPVFLLRGQDKYATAGIFGYVLGLESWKQHEQAEEASKAKDEMVSWQAKNPDRVKNPDHRHVPVPTKEG